MKSWLTLPSILLCTSCAGILLAMFPDYAAWAGRAMYGIGSILIFLIFLRRYRTEKTNTQKIGTVSSESIQTSKEQVDEIRSRIRERKEGKKR